MIFNIYENDLAAKKKYVLGRAATIVNKFNLLVKSSTNNRSIGKADSIAALLITIF